VRIELKCACGATALFEDRDDMSAPYAAREWQERHGGCLTRIASHDPAPASRNPGSDPSAGHDTPPAPDRNPGDFGEIVIRPCAHCGKAEPCGHSNVVLRPDGTYAYADGQWTKLARQPDRNDGEGGG
jgi:hypothetical protein